jgi:hypothetical protein
MYYRTPLRLHFLRVKTALLRLLQIRDLTRLQMRTDNISLSRAEGKLPYLVPSQYINMYVTDDVTNVYVAMQMSTARRSHHTKLYAQQNKVLHE